MQVVKRKVKLRKMVLTASELHIPFLTLCMYMWIERELVNSRSKCTHTGYILQDSHDSHSLFYLLAFH